MNADIKAAWVAALRSGEYQQGKGRLHIVDTNSYCCLGVLCDLAKQAGIVEESPDGSFFSPDESAALKGNEGKHAWGNATFDLCWAVRDWAETPDTNPMVAGHRLSSWNDGGTPFAKIADLIEEYL